MEAFLIITRIFTPFHELLDADSINVNMVVMQMINIGDIRRCPPSVMWFLTGETPESFQELVDMISENVSRPIHGRNFRQVRRLNPEYEVLLTIVWMRHYPPLTNLAREFSCALSNVCEVVRHVVSAINEILLLRQVHWHDVHTWDSFQGRRNIGIIII